MKMTVSCLFTGGAWRRRVLFLSSRAMRTTSHSPCGQPVATHEESNDASFPSPRPRSANAPLPLSPRAAALARSAARGRACASRWPRSVRPSRRGLTLMQFLRTHQELDLILHDSIATPRRTIVEARIDLDGVHSHQELGLITHRTIARPPFSSRHGSTRARPSRGGAAPGSAPAAPVATLRARAASARSRRGGG